MFNKYAVMFLSIGYMFNLNAQNLPLDFENTQHQFTVFGGVEFSRVKDPLRPNNNVGSFKNTAGGNYEGAFIDLKSGINLDSSQKIIFSVFHTTSDSFSVQFKLEQSTSGQPDIFVQKRYKTSTWLTDSFDFSKAQIVDAQTQIVGKGNYKRFTLFFDAGISKAGQYYLDDIKGFIPSGGSQQNTGVTHYGKLVWADEFDYSGAPKSENWHHQVIAPNNGSWFNGEIQHYTDKIDNSYVSEGSMKIVLKKERYTFENNTKEYTSARLNSKFAFTYGRVDVRAKIPAGNGVWPAIWTLGTNVGETGNYWGRDANTVGWPKCGEIDIMESWGHNPKYVSSAVHTQARFGGVETGGTFLPDPYNNYHVYSLVWSPEKLMFFVDSVEIYTYQPDPLTVDNWPFTKDQYILLNVAVLPQVDASFDSALMEIDYVRVYQQGKDSGTLNRGNIKTEETGKIYPNPVKNKIFIENINKYEGYVIMDMGGRVVKRGLLQGTDGIAVQELAGGLYHLRLMEASNSDHEVREVYFRVIKE